MSLAGAAQITEQLKAIRAEVTRSRGLPAYEAVDVAWVALVKTANLLPGNSEHDRMLTLLKRLPEDRLAALLLSEPVDALLNLDPPLESLLTAQHERIDKDRTATELGNVRAKRRGDPREALHNLAN